VTLDAERVATTASLPRGYAVKYFKHSSGPGRGYRVSQIQKNPALRTGWGSAGVVCISQACTRHQRKKRAENC
jgi:hypothetical protein